MTLELLDSGKLMLIFIFVLAVIQLHIGRLC